MADAELTRPHTGGKVTIRAIDKLRRVKRAEDPMYEEVDFVVALDQVTGKEVAYPVVNLPIPWDCLATLRSQIWYRWKSSLLVDRLEDSFNRIVRYVPKRDQRNIKDSEYLSLLLLKFTTGGEPDMALRRIVEKVRAVRRMYVLAGKEKSLPGPFDFRNEDGEVDFPPPGLFDDVDIEIAAKEYFSREEIEQLGRVEEPDVSVIEDEVETDIRWGSNVAPRLNRLKERRPNDPNGWM